MERKELLEGLLKIEGIRGVFLLNSEGVCIGEAFRSSSNSDSLYSFTHDALQVNREFASSFNRGVFSQGHLEFEDEFLSIEPARDNQALVVVAKSGANVGRIRLEMKKIRKQMEEMSA